MIKVNDQFRIVNSIEELLNEISYDSLYVTSDPDKALIFYLMTMQYRTVNCAYSNYKHCNFLGGSPIVLLHNNDIPEQYKQEFVDGFYYRYFSQYEKYRSSFPFPYTPARYADDAVKLQIEEAKALMPGLDITITDRKSLKAKWGEVEFNLTWIKKWISLLSIEEKKKIEERKMEANDQFQKFLTEVFSGIDGLERQREYWDRTQFKNEWKAKFKYGEIRFTPYKHKTYDGTYIIEADSSLLGNQKILKNHRKVIVKMIQLTKKYQEDISALL